MVVDLYLCPLPLVQSLTDVAPRHFAPLPPGTDFSHHYLPASSSMGSDSYSLYPYPEAYPLSFCPPLPSHSVMEVDTNYNSYYDVRLIMGCYIEAMHCDNVAGMLEQLAQHIDHLMSGAMHLRALIQFTYQAARQLQRLCLCASSCTPHRRPLLLPYLQIFLPSLRKTLSDISSICNDRSRRKSDRWRRMYHELSTEGGYISLPARFEMFNAYINSLFQLLMQSVTFEPSELEQMKEKLMFLRGGQKIEAPAGPTPDGIRGEAFLPYDGSLHWAEKIFTTPLPSRTLISGSIVSMVYGNVPGTPHVPLMTPGSRVLMHKEFNNGRIKLTVHLDSKTNIPMYCCRNEVNHRFIHSVVPAQHLIVERDGVSKGHGLSNPTSALVLRELSPQEQRRKVWMTLAFTCWEELVLMWTTSHVLKIHSSPPVTLLDGEYEIFGEESLFQAMIHGPDKTIRSLSVLEESQTGARRLYCAVYEGRYRKATIWTAFITHVSKSPQWLERKGKRRVHLKDLQLYIFSNDFDEQVHRQTPGGVFEVHFATIDACDHFVDLFAPPNTSAPITMSGAS